MTISSTLEDGTPQQSGGGSFFLHVENECLVTDNYRCDQTDTGSSYTELPYFIPLTDHANGSYSTDYTIRREGVVTTSVVLARQGGFYAEYFNNAFLSGVPTLTKIEDNLAFDWQEGLITPEAGEFASIHFYGKIRAPKSEDYTFVLSGDEGFRFYFQG